MTWHLTHWRDIRPGMVVFGPDQTAYEVRRRDGWTFVLMSWHGQSRTVTAAIDSLPVNVWYAEPAAKVDPIATILIAFPGSHVMADVEHGGLMWRCPMYLASTELEVHLSDFHGEPSSGVDQASIAALHAHIHRTVPGLTHVHQA